MQQQQSVIEDESRTYQQLEVELQQESQELTLQRQTISTERERQLILYRQPETGFASERWNHQPAAAGSYKEESQDCSAGTSHAATCPTT